MDTKTTKSNKIVAAICLALIIIMFISVILMAFTRLVLVKKFGMHNAFTDLVFADNDRMNIFVDWNALYPFDDQEQESEAIETSLVDRYKQLVFSTEDKIGLYVREYLFGYNKETELAKKYDALIGWDFVSYSEYNGTVQLSDGYFVNYIEEREVDECAYSLIDFNKYLKNKDIDFVYVQAPYKISEYQDADISGYVDFSNQNVNKFLEIIGAGGVPYCDIREYIHEAGYDNHELFYVTDPHWKTTTGLWASKIIMDYCNENFETNADTSLLEIENFRQDIYEDWFLGSQGKKVTLSKASPEDFIALYPNFPTEYHFAIPTLGIDLRGDFSVTYNMDQLEEKDLYNKSPYGACSYGDNAYAQIENSLASDDKKILFIHDSFGDCVMSNLALCEQRVDSLDLRIFYGSLKAFIEINKPDIVIIMFNPNQIGGTVNWDSHLFPFDFR